MIHSPKMWDEAAALVPTRSGAHPLETSAFPSGPLAKMITFLPRTARNTVRRYDDGLDPLSLLRGEPKVVHNIVSSGPKTPVDKEAHANSFCGVNIAIGW